MQDRGEPSGGANPSRERMLVGLAARGLLDYVVGGPWREPSLGALCLSPNVPAERAAALYQDTDIVVNVFRDRHHYNREGVVATAMNPRVCEALACGALVLSEPRDELLREVPELPTFCNEGEAAALIERFLADPADRSRVQQACAARLRDATYSQRLKTVMDIALDSTPPAIAARPASTPVGSRSVRALPPAPERVVAFDADWDDLGGVVRTADCGELVIDPGTDRGAGVERGLTSRAHFEVVDLTFEV